MEQQFSNTYTSYLRQFCAMVKKIFHIQLQYQCVHHQHGNALHATSKLEFFKSVFIYFTLSIIIYTIYYCITIIFRLYNTYNTSTLLSDTRILVSLIWKYPSNGWLIIYIYTHTYLNNFSRACFPLIQTVFPELFC